MKFNIATVFKCETNSPNPKYKGSYKIYHFYLLAEKKFLEVKLWINVIWNILLPPDMCHPTGPTIN